MSARLGNYVASAAVLVAQQHEPPRIGIQIKLTDQQDFGSYRAKWGDGDAPNPNILYVSTPHKSIRRYCGPGPDFAGQHEPHFRVLLAEIVAESVCRKALTLQARERPGDFCWAALGNDEDIADGVIAKLQQKLRDFVAEAHEIMLSDAGLPAPPLRAASAGTGR